MPGELVEVREYPPGRGLDHGPLGIGAGERPDRLDRVPEGQGKEFGALARLAPQETGAAMPGDVAQSGKHRRRCMPLIGVGIPFAFRRALPKSSDHPSLIP